jgi:predicted ABC-type transport system involved in lysophospholipase L1 biosynthesis ATPase subunit
VLVTHSPDLAARYASRTVELVDGRIAGVPENELQEVVA